ncbi:hypothetical protein [uncultured Paracoccus sp.]|uniref:hypothetical protein n=1 Tax=uncultured Paracoccus sp. TaxID=189685 RepID=UPI0025D52AF4|nr:hypothetical protein [uncultured Paracoccus sp.]
MSNEVMAYWVERETGSFFSMALEPADLCDHMDYADTVRLKFARRALALTVIPMKRLNEDWARAAIENVRDAGAERRREIAQSRFLASAP